MGLYPNNCVSCGHSFMWQSGSLVQICHNCINQSHNQPRQIKPTENTMEINKNLEQQIIEALKATIVAKDELIANLKAEVERLKGHSCLLAPGLLSTPNNIAPINPANPEPFIDLTEPHKPSVSGTSITIDPTSPTIKATLTTTRVSDPGNGVSIFANGTYLEPSDVTLWNLGGFDLSNGPSKGK